MTTCPLRAVGFHNLAQVDGAVGFLNLAQVDDVDELAAKNRENRRNWVLTRAPARAPAGPVSLRQFASVWISTLGLGLLPKDSTRFAKWLGTVTTIHKFKKGTTKPFRCLDCSPLPDPRDSSTDLLLSTGNSSEYSSRQMSEFSSQNFVAV